LKLARADLGDRPAEARRHVGLVVWPLAPLDLIEELLIHDRPA
jgi:hypothetical protein